MRFSSRVRSLIFGDSIDCLLFLFLLQLTHVFAGESDELFVHDFSGRISSSFCEKRFCELRVRTCMQSSCKGTHAWIVCVILVGSLCRKGENDVTSCTYGQVSRLYIISYIITPGGKI